jgi:hypothetical protein
MSDEVAALRDDPHVEVSLQDEHSRARVAATETDVVHVTSIAKRHTSRLVDAITTHASLGEDGMSAT